MQKPHPNSLKQPNCDTTPAMRLVLALSGTLFFAHQSAAPPTDHSVSCRFSGDQLVHAAVRHHRIRACVGLVHSCNKFI